MMPASKLVRIAAANTLRSPRHFVLSAFGIVIGISSFVFFLALSTGVRNVILGKIFPIERVEVRAPRASLLGQDLTKKLDNAAVELIRARKDVASAVPRMTVVFPASGRGYFDDQEIKFEVGGFCDGIDPGYVSDEKFASLFADWESPAHVAAQKPCGPAPDHACADSELYYCDKRDMKCHHRVPVMISPTLLELYNGQFASSHGLPMIGAFEQFIVERGGLGKMRFYIGLGDTMVAGSNTAILESQRREVQGVLIGISDKAMSLGITVPIQYVEKWNREYAGEEAATSYSSIIVTLRDKDDLAPFTGWLESPEPRGPNLRVQDSLGTQFATAIFIVTILFVLISVIIVTISAINIAHNFFMQVSERRREIGVLRAVGATQADVRVMILGESALIGLVGGLLGILLARCGGLIVDWASATLLPHFPFKPPTYFAFQEWILAMGLGFAVLFCVLGGFLPARRAAQMAPAKALAQQ